MNLCAVFGGFPLDRQQFRSMSFSIGGRSLIPDEPREVFGMSGINSESRSVPPAPHDCASCYIGRDLQVGSVTRLHALAARPWCEPVRPAIRNVVVPSDCTPAECDIVRQIVDHLIASIGNKTLDQVGLGAFRRVGNDMRWLSWPLYPAFHGSAGRNLREL